MTSQPPSSTGSPLYLPAQRRTVTRGHAVSRGRSGAHGARRGYGQMGSEGLERVRWGQDHEQNRGQTGYWFSFPVPGTVSQWRGLGYNDTEDLPAATLQSGFIRTATRCSHARSIGGYHVDTGLHDSGFSKRIRPSRRRSDEILL